MLNCTHRIEHLPQLVFNLFEFVLTIIRWESDMTVHHVRQVIDRNIGQRVLGALRSSFIDTLIVAGSQLIALEVAWLYAVMFNDPVDRRGLLLAVSTAFAIALAIWTTCSYMNMRAEYQAERAQESPRSYGALLLRLREVRSKLPRDSRIDLSRLIKEVWERQKKRTPSAGRR